jgi:hypothetical protein
MPTLLSVGIEIGYFDSVSVKLCTELCASPSACGPSAEKGRHVSAGGASCKKKMVKIYPWHPDCTLVYANASIAPLQIAIFLSEVVIASFKTVSRQPKWENKGGVLDARLEKAELRKLRLRTLAESTHKFQII